MTTFPQRGDGLPVLLRRSLVSAGYTDAEIRRAVRSGEVERLDRGALSEPVSCADPHQLPLNRYIRRVMARALTVPSGIVSHLSAAALHGLPADCAPLDTVHVTRPGVGGARRRIGFCQHAAAVPPEAITSIGPLRVTQVARTLVDVGRTESLRSAVAIADCALHRGIVTGPEVAQALSEARFRPGTPAAHRAMSLADGRCESVGESGLRVVMHQLGLPAPDLQIEVRSSVGEFLARCDLGYPRVAVLVEFDGLQKYRSLLRPGETPADAVVREKLREQALVEAGYVVVRVTWADLRRPAELARRIRQAMDRGARNVATGAVTGHCMVPEPVTVGC